MCDHVHGKSALIGFSWFACHGNHEVYWPHIFGAIQSCKDACKVHIY